MEIEPSYTPALRRTLQPRHVYLLAALCLIGGLVVGYAARGTRMPAAPPQHALTASLPPGHPAMGAGHMPSLEELKRMADKQVAPLLEKLKADPNNTNLLLQVGAIYHATHQFKEAAAYYDRAVLSDPKNVSARTKLAASLYRSGDADAALAQLNQALAIDPKDANSLFNLGMVKWQGKQDAPGAVAAWKRLLNTNPQLPEERKAMVQHLMAQAQTSPRTTLHD
jgi:cytochrome c-type biogenesis protein CcmH/NrfG